MGLSLQLRSVVSDVRTERVWLMCFRLCVCLFNLPNLTNASPNVSLFKEFHVVNGISDEDKLEIINIFVYDYGQFSKFRACFCGLDSGNLKFETVRANKQHTIFRIWDAQFEILRFEIMKTDRSMRMMCCYNCNSSVIRS